MPRILAIVLLSAAAVLVAGTTSDAAYWDIEQVYGGGFASGDSSIAIGSGNIPSISYAAAGTLFYSTKGAGTWSTEPVATVGFWGGYSSLAFNSSWQPGIAFVDASGESNVVKYAYRSSGAWTAEAVQDVGWLPDFVALDFNAAGQPCIGYTRTTGTYPDEHYYLCLARRTGVNSWVRQDVAEIGGITGPSLVIDSSDRYHVAFADSATGALKLATRTGTGAWSVQPVDGSLASPVVWYTSIALQPDGQPAVVYFQSSSSSVALKLARKAGGAWHIDTAATLATGGPYYCSAALTSTGVPVVLYQDPATTSLKCAWPSGGSWFSQTVDSGSRTGLRPCLAADALGNLDASYVDSSNGNVQFAWAVAPRSVTDARSLADGQTVQVSAVAATSAAGELPQMVYVQQPDRSSGIQLRFTGAVPAVARGVVVDIQGALGTVNGERVISDPLLVELGAVDEPGPLGMCNSRLGGSGFHYVPGPPARGQQGVTGGTGLNNIGLLVRTWGVFHYVDPHTFKVSDGSGPAVKCVTPADVTVSPAWQYVSVTGLSSCEQSGSDLLRLLRVRSLSDIKVEL